MSALRSAFAHVTLSFSTSTCLLSYTDNGTELIYFSLHTLLAALPSGVNNGSCSKVSLVSSEMDNRGSSVQVKHLPI